MNADAVWRSRFMPDADHSSVSAMILSNLRHTCPPFTASSRVEAPRGVPNVGKQRPWRISWRFVKQGDNAASPLRARRNRLGAKARRGARGPRRKFTVWDTLGTLPSALISNTFN
jgi:hypothetical protein